MAYTSMKMKTRKGGKMKKSGYGKGRRKMGKKMMKGKKGGKKY